MSDNIVLIPLDFAEKLLDLISNLESYEGNPIPELNELNKYINIREKLTLEATREIIILQLLVKILYKVMQTPGVVTGEADLEFLRDIQEKFKLHDYKSRLG